MRLLSRAELRAALQSEWLHLTTFQPSDRTWRMPIAAALASGAPLLVGAWFGHPAYGLVSSLGGMVFLYLPETSLSHRMITIMACAFGMIACYALGVVSHFFPLLLTPALAFAAILVTFVCRFYRLAPPGNVFFIMAASIGMFSPGAAIEIPLKIGLMTMGCLLACLIAFFYSLYVLRLQPPKPMAPGPPPTFDFVVFDSVIIGLFIGASLALAQALHVERAYWAPVSCAAVIQGASLRAVWTRQMHRVLGTAIGLLLTWALLLAPLDGWTAPLIMTALAFVIETLVVRHYGLAVIFITPMAIFLAEAATLGHEPPNALIAARFLDTLLGCTVGLIGGACLHSRRFRDIAGAPLRRCSKARLER